MVKIKIKDLPKDMKISKEEMKKITGGMMPADTKSGGIYFGFPDVCKTPAPPAPYDPTPYPNIGITEDPVDTKITTATKPSD